MGLTLHGYTVPEGLGGQEHTMKAPGIGIGHLTSLELPRLIILADSDHDDLAATLPERATIFDHDASALATRDSQNDFVAYF